METKIVNITMDNIADHPQAICFINPKHELYHKKIDWMEEQFKNGLVIKLLYIEGEKKPIGFIEYVPGEFCWRAVSAKDYMFIHCLWINGKKHHHQGLGRLLINEAEKDAQNMNGVAVVTSDKSFMTTKDLFIKNGYKIIAESGKDQLLSKQFKNGTQPSINNWAAELENTKDLTIIYSKQCPWVARFIEEVKPILKKEKLKPKIVVLETAEQAQKAPSLYSIFNLIYNGKLLSDRYISTTRFQNIVNKEIKI
ncbi:MAG: GNAT family N-acetyltransferase [Calditrichaeota bacterium]|nr:MAG: GNAT family N-acetyltransferase [Calditrichota bacterium]MBL1207417.1 GNAT family N-acetyltransferase [Calditrichota bacterium]NOG47249.1 GNAT family N-acetyltransferase [Calditrichota bacterium]